MTRLTSIAERIEKRTESDVAHGSLRITKKDYNEKQSLSNWVIGALGKWVIEVLAFIGFIPFVLKEFTSQILILIFLYGSALVSIR